MSKTTMNVVTTSGAASILDISPRRVLDLIYEDCPVCHRNGRNCERCYGTGRRLPAKKMGGSWLIFRDKLDLTDVQNRAVGRPKKYKLDESLKVTTVGIRFKGEHKDEEPPDPSEIGVACEWLRKFCNRRSSFNKSQSSYSIKDAVRRWSGQYVSNGAMIEAALQEGYRAKPTRFAAHVAWFDMSFPRKRTDRYEEARLTI